MRTIESLGAAAGETAVYTICVQTFPERIGFIVVSIHRRFLMQWEWFNM